ncbi:TPA: F0F1 ATP synthase subunit alpha [Legionella pneumophila]|uniref:ATP synthase subunit alpha n=1 Tax=Legionella pneumophila TaxID=446 RepID=A0A2S6EW19_LEGPN|nr:F0F1 ATP synthase subunit alpha [Legionella pneumophila]APF04267.1 F0F1 ATP synthase subunit alpha [Legionella pneumophila subsp. fraseri]APF07250.1 F0F1 ATP synthase subunit alpha [Legionella pneumophila subsp. fraseri]AUB69707.1 F0F1 ATP synthase subunit alpha [Legionella pneumophila]AUB72682.1 F0F1 ATP synthase subunit alpha [Legionella pneumophila]KXB27343.1 ATP F0F1 synthase subunit alpha [Legionella pneumophila]
MNWPNTPSFLEKQRQRLENYQFQVKISEQGEVVSVGDGIIWIKGLPGAAIDEILISEDNCCIAMVFHLTEDLVGAVMLVQTKKLKAGTSIFPLKRVLSIPVGDKLLGRVIDPLGNPLDGGEIPPCDEQGLLDRLSPPIIHRDFVSRPFYTGNKIIDNLIPIGKGQRELIIGDNGLGKSSLAIDIVMNQKDKRVYCVYVLIGQKRSTVSTTIQLLKKANALDYTTVVVALATALPGLLYLAPFAGCAIAEHWMKKGLDTLVVYDDLSAHANSYRELSLLLRRPPGREAFPADIFYLHSRLLERSTCLSPAMGGGSMTALPIIETKEGDIATYIPTNLISITDGQIFFDESLFSSGFLPAIDITKSVSRVGGKAQHLQIKKEASRMKLDYMQFLDLEMFTRFGARLDAKMQKQIQKGRILREILKQERFSPLPIEFQLAWLIAYNEGFFDELNLEDIPQNLKKIEEEIKQSNWSLGSTREQWKKAIKEWLMA